MQEDQTGKDIYTSKLDIVSNSQDLVEFKNIVSDILKNNVIVDLNYFLKEEKASIFDYKKASKNTSELQDLATKLLKDYEKDVKRAKTRSISEQWNAFKNQNMQ